MDGQSVRKVSLFQRLVSPWNSGPVLAWMVVLAAVSLVTKIILLPFEVDGVLSFIRWGLRLAVVAAPDLCFVTGLAIISIAITGTLARWPVVQRMWLRSLVCFCCLSGWYAVASLPMYRVTMAPFSLRLIAFAGGPEMMSSSLHQYFPPGAIAALLVVPILLFCLPRQLARWRWFQMGAPVRPGLVAGTVALVTLYGAVCDAYVDQEWNDPYRWERRIAQSPHAVLLASCVEEILKENPFSYTFSFDEIDESDFRTPAPRTPFKFARSASDPTLVSSLPEDERPKNILYILMESTSAEYLNMYGGKWDTMPKLTKMVEEKGLVFDNAYSQASASSKAIISLLSSTYCRPDWRLVIRDCPDFDVPTIGQCLQADGFKTLFIHASYWDWRGRDKFLQGRGVDSMIDARDLPAEPINSWGVSDRVMFEATVDWMDKHREQPFLAFACTIETHHPYAPSANPVDFGEKDEHFERYLNTLRTTDDNIAWVMDELVRRGLDKSTLVVVTSDHGECFGQHSQRVHGFGVNESNVHVPLVMIHPSLKRFGKRNQQIHQHIDLAPTLLDLVGVEAPKDWQGQSMLAENPERRAYFAAMANQVVLGLRDGRMKYHYYVDNNFEELFDVTVDPGEKNNLVEANPELAAEYKRRLGGFVSFQHEYLAKHGAGKANTNYGTDFQEGRPYEKVD